MYQVQEAFRWTCEIRADQSRGAASGWVCEEMLLLVACFRICIVVADFHEGVRCQAKPGECPLWY